MTQLDLFGIDFPAIEPQTAVMPEPYEVGSVLYSSWGYEQTDIDFYLVIARKGDWVTVQPMNKVKTYNGHMSGTCVPAEVVEIAKPMRRRLRMDDRGVCYGCKGPDSYNSLRAWDGTPRYFSEYA